MVAIIIGGGAGGIACAIRLKQNMPEAKVMVLEHLDAPCKKIYATGNGRCNITNTAAQGYAVTKAFFSSIGLMMRESAEGRMYPYSNQASGVVDTLLAACRQYDIKIITECTVRRVENIGGQFNVFTNHGILYSDVLVLATGGKSQSALGSDGSGYAYAEAFGHTITPLSPALVQLRSSNKNCRALKGLRSKCRVSVETNGKIVAQEQGELLFTDYGISGIVVMNLSGYISDERLQSGKDKCVVIVDFVPEKSEKELAAHYQKFGSLVGILPHRLCKILSKQADGDVVKIAKYAKNQRLIITGTKGYDFAQITGGGVRTDELTDANESKLCEKLYIIGELTDNQFPCGGFNLDYAFSSGIRAADDMAEKEYDTD